MINELRKHYIYFILLCISTYKGRLREGKGDYHIHFIFMDICLIKIDKEMEEYDINSTSVDLSVTNNKESRKVNINFIIHGRIYK